MPKDSIDEFGIVKKLGSFKRRMKRSPTPAERAFHEFLIETGNVGRVRRQVVFGWYILDFYVQDRMVAIEFDGSSHSGREKQDAFRDSWLASYGVTVIRYPNQTAFSDPQSILCYADTFQLVPEAISRDASRRAEADRKDRQKQLLKKNGLRFNSRGALVEIPQPETAKSESANADKTCVVGKRLVNADGRRSRPRCQHCGTALGQRWKNCRGCGSTLVRDLA